MLLNYHADGQTFKFQPRPAQEFQFQFLFFQHSDSVWLRLPRPWPGMPRSANLAGVTNCTCCLNPSNSFFEVEAPWMKTHEPNRLFRPWKLVEASWNSTAINLQKLPKMWRLLMRVEKSLMVLSLVPEPTWRNIQHLKDYPVFKVFFFDFSFERLLFHDPLDTLALKGLSSATHAQPALE